jgi:hypothetical protein
MKKLVVSAIAAMALIAVAPANADPKDPNPGCGDVFTAGAGPGFGQSVSEAAKGNGFNDEVAFFCE